MIELGEKLSKIFFPVGFNSELCWSTCKDMQKGPAD